MPDISKINALAIGSVAKVDGLAKASILDIDGVAVPSALPAPTQAYSVRLLSDYVTYTGPAMRVRRDTGGGTGDDDEADIAFDSGVISLDSAISNASAGVTATTLGQFLNVGTVGGTTYTNPDSLTVTASCFVDEWKDQSGNAYHAEQATHTKQPKIHNGTVNTDLIQENGLPALSYDGGDELNYTWPSGSGATQLYGEDYMWFSVVNPPAGSYPVLYMQASSTNINTRMGQHHSTTDNLIYVMRVSAVLSYSSSTTLTTGQRILTTQSIFTSTSDRDFYSYLNGSQVGTGNFTGTYADNTEVVFAYLRIGAQYTFFYNGTMQEAVMFSGDVASQRSDVELNINNYFSAY